MYGPSISLSISPCKSGFSECLPLGDTTNCATSLLIRFGLPFVASKHISGLPLVQYPKPVKNPNVCLFVFAHVKPTVLYLNPHASITLKAWSNIGSHTHINNTQFSSAISLTGKLQISFSDIHS